MTKPTCGQIGCLSQAKKWVPELQDWLCWAHFREWQATKGGA